MLFMEKRKMLKKILLLSSLILVVAIVAFAAGQKMAAKNKFGLPNSLLHVVTVRWKADSTEAQRKAALEGVKTMAAKTPGIKNIWLKTVKVQGGDSDKPYNAVFAMEFVDEAALKAYASHPAHDEWMKVYGEVRDESRTHDVSNDVGKTKE